MVLLSSQLQQRCLHQCCCQVLDFEEKLGFQFLLVLKCWNEPPVLIFKKNWWRLQLQLFESFQSLDIALFAFGVQKLCRALLGALIVASIVQNREERLCRALLDTHSSLDCSKWSGNEEDIPLVHLFKTFCPNTLWFLSMLFTSYKQTIQCWSLHNPLCKMDQAHNRFVVSEAWWWWSLVHLGVSS